jgi:hypothetical protein
VNHEPFWELVAQTLRDAQALPAPRRGLLRRPVALRPGERHVVALTRALEAVDDAALVAFQASLDALRADADSWDLWGAGALALGSMGDDAFLDLRTWLVSQGRAAYARVTGDPDALAELAPPDLDERLGDAETWGYVALEVWDARSEQEMPRPGFRKTAPTGEPFDAHDEPELRRRWPRLAARSGRLGG